MSSERLVICPRCRGNREVRESAYHLVLCPTCEGDGQVSQARADEHLALHGRRPSPPPPAPEVEIRFEWDGDDEEEVTLVPCPACRHCYRCKGKHFVPASKP